MAAVALTLDNLHYVNLSKRNLLMFPHLARTVAFAFAVIGFSSTAYAQGTTTTAEITAPQTSTPTTTPNGERVLTGEEIRTLISGKKFYFDWKPLTTSTRRARYDFSENGTFMLYHAGTRSGSGTWSIKNTANGDVLCTEYNVYAREGVLCREVVFKDNAFYIGILPLILP